MDSRRVWAALFAPASCVASMLLAGCGGAAGSSVPALAPNVSSQASTRTAMATTGGSAATIVQIASGNNGGGAGYSIAFPAAPNAGDALFGGLTVSFSGNASRTTSIDTWKVLDALGQPSNTNGNLAASSYTLAAIVGESNTEIVAESGGNWASGVLYDVANADASGAVAADQWGRGSDGAVTCPAVSAPRAGSLVVCEVYLDAGTANAAVIQAPVPGSGWTFDRAAGGQYEEVFGFHANAPTGANQTVPAMQFNLKSGGGYLANWLAETVVIQPPNPALTATPIPWPSSAVETPKMADAFVDSAGVNVHLAFAGTLYTQNFPRVLSLLQGLGVRHVRDGIVLGQPAICTEYAQLATAGVHVDDVTAPGMDQTTIAQWAPCAGAAIEAVEGPNEYDKSGDPNWAATDVTAQRNLYPAVKAAAPSLAIYGPAVTTSAAYAALGDLSSVEDDGNMHDYMAGRNPGNPGWGSADQFGTYGSIAWNMAVAAQASRTRPLISTETGYSDTAGVVDAVPAATKGRYEVRTLLEHWLAGVPRTYLYELIDENVDSFIGYGLTDAAGSPKPAYVAIENLLAHLRDPGPSFTPTALKYAVGAPASVQHVLLQRRNGTYALIVWNEVPEWDPVAGTAIAVAPQPVTLTFYKTPSSLAVTTFGDGGATQSAALAVSSGQATLTATNQVQIIDITP